jgi:hypothetical protein
LFPEITARIAGAVGVTITLIEADPFGVVVSSVTAPDASYGIYMLSCAGRNKRQVELHGVGRNLRGRSILSIFSLIVK